MRIMNFMNRIGCRFILSLAFVIFSVAMVSSVLQAQIIHVMVVADTNVDRAGEGVAKSVRIDKEQIEKLFRENVPAAQLSICSLPVEKVWADDILKAIDQVNIAPDDTFVFVYTGHGAYDATKKQQFFQLAYNHKAKQPYPGQSDLYRDDVLKRIEDKSPRLTVFLTDCCNVASEPRVVSRNAEARSGGITIQAKTMSPGFESLFIYCKGTVDVTSSKLGEYSGVDGKNWKGSCFTYPLVELMKSRRDDETLSWPTLINEVTPKVQEAYKAAYPNVTNGQYTQTVFTYGLPGDTSKKRYDGSEEPVPNPPRPRYRFGVGAVAHEGGGVRITELVANMPGQKSGLEVGDIILEINGKPVNSEQEYSDAVDNSPKEMQVKLKNVQDGKVITPTIELGW